MAGLFHITVFSVGGGAGLLPTVCCGPDLQTAGLELKTGGGPDRRTRGGADRQTRGGADCQT